MVDGLFNEDPRLGRRVKLYLSQQYTSLKLADIGKQFGISESGVSQASRRITAKLNSDKRFKSKISLNEKN
jgi:chromosomal replication initiation ATPase DnaA